MALLQAAYRADSAPARLAPNPTAASAARLIRVDAGEIPMPPETPSAHASTLAPLASTHPASVAAAWFAGERESAPDVRIAFSSFDKATQRWTPATFIVDRHTLGDQLGFGIRRLGNPVLWRDDRERLHLFVVGTGIGGWATSRIVHLQQTADSRDAPMPRFQAHAVLPLSWLWNLSYLVRNTPLILADGAAVLPIYFELGSKYPALARFDRAGNFVGVTRISDKTNLLQPALLPLDERHWLAYMRMSGGSQRIALAETRDAGEHWQDLPDLPLSNPNASVAVINVGGTALLTHNPSSHGREHLVTSISSDGREWIAAAELARGVTGDEYSYPAMLWHEDSLWISYTDRRRRIAWQRFSIERRAP